MNSKWVVSTKSSISISTVGTYNFYIAVTIGTTVHLVDISGNNVFTLNVVSSSSSSSSTTTISTTTTGSNTECYQYITFDSSITQLQVSGISGSNITVETDGTNMFTTSDTSLCPITSYDLSIS